MENMWVLAAVWVGLAHKLHETLQLAAAVFEISDVRAEEEFAGVLREMPTFALGCLTFRLRRPMLLTFQRRRLSEKPVTKRNTRLVGDQIMRSLSAYRVLLDDWSGRGHWDKSNGDWMHMRTAIELRWRDHWVTKN
jgi:hypothetical protein